MQAMPERLRKRVARADIASRRAAESPILGVVVHVNGRLVITLVGPRQDWLRTALFRQGHPVERVKPAGLGSLRAAALELGEFRELAKQEVQPLASEAMPSSPHYRRPLAM
jgi:16S rRNA U516 pseudouridylate synthase RsuA-like enzyme